MTVAELTASGGNTDSMAREPDPLDSAEWDRCRSTIVDYDKIVADLRKYGFTIVTGLLSVGAFLATTTPNSVQLPNAAKAGIAGVIAVLVTALFFVDRYYVVQQSGASRRAVHIERENWAAFAIRWARACSSGASLSALISSEPPFPENPHGDAAKYLSEVLNRYATQSFSLYVALLLYLSLIVATLGLGVVIIRPQPVSDASIGAAFASTLTDLLRGSTYAAAFAGDVESIGEAVLAAFLLFSVVSLLISGTFFFTGFVQRVSEAFAERKPESASRASGFSRLAAAVGLVSIIVALMLVPLNLLFELAIGDHAIRGLVTIFVIAVAAILGYFVLTERQFETAMRRGGRYFQSRSESFTNAKALFTSAEHSVRAIWSYSRYDEPGHDRSYFADTMNWAANQEVHVTRLIDVDSLNLDDIVRHLWEARNDIGEFYEPRLVHRTGFEMLIADRHIAALYFHIGQRPPPGAHSARTSTGNAEDDVSLWEVYFAPMHVSLIGDMFDEKARKARDLDVTLLRELSAAHEKDMLIVQAKLRNWIIQEMLSERSCRERVNLAYFFAYGTELDQKLLADIKLSIYGRHRACWRGVELVFRKQRFRDDEEGCATAELAPGKEIHGVAYEVDEADIKSNLERFIGVPGHYVRQEPIVTLSTGEEVQAYAYVSADRWLGDASDGLKPSEDNMTHMLSARDMLPPAYVLWLEAQPRLDGTALPFTRAVAKLVTVINGGTWTGSVDWLHSELATLYRRREPAHGEPKLSNVQVVHSQLRKQSNALRRSGYEVALSCCGWSLCGWCLRCRRRSQRVAITRRPPAPVSSTQQTAKPV